MNTARCYVVALAGLLVSGAATLAAPTKGPKLPVVDGRAAVAIVNGEPIALEDLKRTMDEIDADVRAGNLSPQPPMEVLQRSITAKLIAQEARNVGFQDDEKMKRAVDTFGREKLRDLMLQVPARRVTKADDALTMRLMRRIEGKARVASVMFLREKVDDVTAFSEKLSGGAAFEEAAREAEISASAKFDSGSVWLKLPDLKKEIADELTWLEPGKMGGPYDIAGGSTFVKVLEWSIPDDPETAQKAAAEALSQARLLEVSKLSTELRERYIRVDAALLESLDFEAETPGFAGYKQDTRVVAEIVGGEAIRVSDLTRALEGRFFHGTAQAAKRKEINRIKELALDEIAIRRASVLEAKRLGVDRWPEFRQALAEYEESQMFGMYVERVIRPEVVTTDAEVRSYFDSHRDAFKGPETVRLESVPFETLPQAEAAVSRLRAGALLDWVRSNMPGTIPDKDPRVSFDPRGKIFTWADLPKEARVALEGAKVGEYRVFTTGEIAHAVNLVEIIPPQRLELEEAQRAARGKVVQQKIQASVKELEVQLRKAGEIKLFVDAKTLPVALAGVTVRPPTETLRPDAAPGSAGSPKK